MSSNIISTVPSFDLFSKPDNNAPIISSAFIFYLFLTLRRQWRKDPKQQQQQLCPSSSAVQVIWDQWDWAGLKYRAEAAREGTNTQLPASEHCLDKETNTQDQRQLPFAIWHSPVLLWATEGLLPRKFSLPWTNLSKVPLQKPFGVTAKLADLNRAGTSAWNSLNAYVLVLRS